VRTLFTLLFVLVAAVATAQTAAVNPVTVQCVPSSDHNTVNALDGTPMVSRYEMRIYLSTDLTKVVFTQDMGKPTPVANLITVTNALWFSGLTPNTKYVAKVAAIGPTGEGVSDPSNPFGNVGPPAAPTALVLKR